MNAMEFARENHKRWQEVKELVNVLGHMDDLLMRIMRDVQSVAEMKNYVMAMHALKTDAGSVLGSVYDMHIRVQLLCSEACNAADAFELACDKVQVAS